MWPQFPPDLTPPSWTSTYPKSGTATETSIQVTGNINEAGTIFFVVLANGAAAPSSAQVVAGTDASGSALAADRKGNDGVAANTDKTFTITGLTHSTAYDVYLVARDAAVNQNLQATPFKLDVNTATADTTPPSWSSGPAQGTMGSTTGQVTAAISEAGKMYAVILADGATAPSYAQVKAGQDGSGGALAAGFKASNTSVAATTLTTLSFSGLTASTAYDVYIAAEDNAGTPNTLGPVKVDVTTGAAGGSITDLLITEWADAGTDVDYIEIRNFGTSTVTITSSF
jgi:hypothetical protein